MIGATLRFVGTDTIAWCSSFTSVFLASTGTSTTTFGQITFGVLTGSTLEGDFLCATIAGCLTCLAGTMPGLFGTICTAPTVLGDVGIYPGRGAGSCVGDRNGTFSFVTGAAAAVDRFLFLFLLFFDGIGT